MPKKANKSASVLRSAPPPAPHGNASQHSGAGRKTFTFSALRPNRGLRAKYDVAEHTPEMEALWRGADSLSSALANSPAVRRTIRNRARYEYANNSYLRGIVNTLAADIIGPTICLQIGGGEEANRIEKSFRRWMRETKLLQKLILFVVSKAVDGEVFVLFFTNRRLKHEVKLDVRAIECDMISSFYSDAVLSLKRPEEQDGIRFDENGLPTEYRLLKYHPGDYRGIQTGAGDWVKAEFMLHYFTPFRPGQIRGVSDVVAGMALGGKMRRYTESTVKAATTAANISALMETTLTPGGECAELAEPTITLDIDPGTLMSLPEGWTAKQMKAEQPTSTYPEFKKEIITEMGRGLGMPYNIAAGTSAGYNYASGRLDNQSYDRANEVERGAIVADLLAPIFEAWLAEYHILHPISAETLEQCEDAGFYFRGRPHVDPNKEANAEQTRLQNHTTTLAEIYAAQGKDWQRECRQSLNERIELEAFWHEQRKAAGLDPLPFPTGAYNQPQQVVDGPDDDEPQKEPENE